MAVKVAEQSPQKALEALEAECAARIAAAASHRANPPLPTDLAAVPSHRLEQKRLDRDVKDAEDAVAFQLRVVERAEADAADRASKAANEALKQEAEGPIADAVHRIMDRSELMLPDLQLVADHRARVDAANANSAIRKFGHITDGERLMRERPGGEVPEILGEVEVWVDGSGRRPTVSRIVDGQKVGMDGSPLRLAKESYVVRPAGFDPGHMPARLAEAVKLVDLAGKPLWARD